MHLLTFIYILLSDHPVLHDNVGVQRDKEGECWKIFLNGRLEFQAKAPLDYGGK